MKRIKGEETAHSVKKRGDEATGRDRERAWRVRFVWFGFFYVNVFTFL